MDWWSTAAGSTARPDGSRLVDEPPQRPRGRIARPIALPAAMLVAFAVVLGCALALGGLLGLAERPDGSTAVDASITSWVVAHRTSGVTTLARVFSTIGSQIVLAPLAAVVTIGLLVRRRFVQAVLLVAAWGGALGLYNITKVVAERPRPPAEIWLTKVGRTWAFPSGHATQSLATLGAVVLIAAVWLPEVRRPLRLIALVLVAGIGWSRVYLGVHWTTDVAGGWLIAAGWLGVLAWLTARATTRDQPRA